jgi:hypothetical protein
MEGSCEYKQSQTANKGWASSWGGGGVSKGLTTPHCKNSPCHEVLHRALDLDRFFGMT